MSYHPMPLHWALMGGDGYLLIRNISLGLSRSSEKGLVFESGSG